VNPNSRTSTLSHAIMAPRATRQCRHRRPRKHLDNRRLAVGRPGPVDRAATYLFDRRRTSADRRHHRGGRVFCPLGPDRRARGCTYLARDDTATSGPFAPVLGLQGVRNYRKGVFVRFTTPRWADIRAAIDSRSAASMSAACRTASSLTASRIRDSGFELGFGIWDLRFA